MQEAIKQAVRDFVDEISHPNWTVVQKAPLRVGVAKVFKDATQGFTGESGVELLATNNLTSEVRSAKESFDRRVKICMARFEEKEDYVRQVMNTPKNLRSNSPADVMASRIQQLCRGQASSVNLTPEQAKSSVEFFARGAASLEIKLPKIPGAPAGQVLEQTPLKRNAQAQGL